MQGRIYPEIPGKLQVFPRQFWIKEFAEAKAIGFSYIELLYDRDEANENPLVQINRIKEIQEHVTFNNLYLHSICADYFTKTTLLDSNDNDPWLKLNYLVDYAEELSITVIVVPFFDRNMINSPEELEHFLKRVESEIIRASEKQVCLCIEATLKAQQILSVFNEIGTSVKICYDLGNATAMGFDIQEEIELLGHFIGLIHIKDRKKDGGPNTLIGNGDVDFINGFKALKKIGYKGNFTLETATGNNPILNAKNHVENVEELIDYLS